MTAEAGLISSPISENTNSEPKEYTVNQYPPKKWQPERRLNLICYRTIPFTGRTADTRKPVRSWLHLHTKTWFRTQCLIAAMRECPIVSISRFSVINLSISVAKFYLLRRMYTFQKNKDTANDYLSRWDGFYLRSERSSSYFLHRENLDSIDCFRFHLEHEASRTCSHNAFRHFIVTRSAHEFLELHTRNKRLN